VKRLESRNNSLQFKDNSQIDMPKPLDQLGVNAEGIELIIRTVSND
jgi:hypothetical protein